MQTELIEMREKSGKFNISEVKIAESMGDRMVGLMFVDEMDGFSGLLIKKCNSIHTFFMKFPLDIIFLDAHFKVVKILRDLRPWRLSPIYFSASMVLELKAGTIGTSLNVGDELEVVCTS